MCVCVRVCACVCMCARARARAHLCPGIWTALEGSMVHGVLCTMWSRISIPVLIKGCWYSVLQVLGTTQLPSEIIQSIAEDLGGYLWTMFRAFCVLNINNGIGLCVCACSSPIAVLNGALNTTIQTRRFVGALTPSRPTLAGNSKFRACDYNLIQNNCNHFSDTFASLICGNGACIVWHLWQRCVHCVTSVATVRALCDICGNGACIVWHLWQRCVHCVTSVATVRALCDICGNGACIVWHLWQWCVHCVTSVAMVLASLATVVQFVICEAGCVVCYTHLP